MSANAPLEARLSDLDGLATQPRGEGRTLNASVASGAAGLFGGARRGGGKGWTPGVTPGGRMEAGRGLGGYDGTGADGRR